MEPDAAAGGTVVGDEAHIISNAEKGPRRVTTISTEDQDRFSNLTASIDQYVNRILLCKIHHKYVDDNEDMFPAASLLQMKSAHEERVRSSLDFDAERQADDETYAMYVDRWIELSNLDQWEAWTSWLLSPTPALGKEMDDRVALLRRWFLSRVWPGRYVELERAFLTFRVVLNELHQRFNEYSDDRGDEDPMLRTLRFYRPHDGSAYDHRLVDKFDFHVGVIYDLTYELTRAANWICSEVRRVLDPRFRLDEGMALVTASGSPDLRLYTYRIEYSDPERECQPLPYVDLEHFLVDRANRELHAGEGTRSDYPDPRRAATEF